MDSAHGIKYEVIMSIWTKIRNILTCPVELSIIFKKPEIKYRIEDIMDILSYPLAIMTVTLYKLERS